MLCTQLLVLEEYVHNVEVNFVFRVAMFND